MNTALLSVQHQYVIYAVLVSEKLQHLYVEKKNNKHSVGDIYCGKVDNVLDNIKSAFITIEDNQNAFIHLSDIIEVRQKLNEQFDIDVDDEQIDDTDTSKSKITDLIKPNDSVLVQVVKEGNESKGARVTSKLSLAGQYVVLLPQSRTFGVSKRIEKSSIRNALKKHIKQMELPDNIGLICRTASQNATLDQITEESQKLLNLWLNIDSQYKKSKKPRCLHIEKNLVKRALDDAARGSIKRLIIDDENALSYCKQHYTQDENNPLSIELYADKVPMIEKFGVENEIKRVTAQKIWLNNGGYLIVDQTEALLAFDVNSGRSNPTEENLEQNLLNINIEAAEEIANVIRLRNSGGIIVCDFIDMKSRKAKKLFTNIWKIA